MTGPSVARIRRVDTSDDADLSGIAGIANVLMRGSTFVGIMDR
jgi:hypothetical protein